MRPNRYPYSGMKKHSTVRAVRVFEKAFVNFVAENIRQSIKAKQELNKASEKFYQLCH
ncbi:hypothetical protein SAMN05660328_1149 [Streptococcus gallolyticus]|uniref:Uncharacterized protein n=1 Tax=Streptococcus gallolyticus TaxID=315405 RepID=A0A1I7JJ32_9STRE|nr:hypothetical protein SAMN02983012_0046 [Streptococcus gallolyticus]SFU85166.1 hypothetical protein SAMN05660328_1149 [Streptococcus gallolyticus]